MVVAVFATATFVAKQIVASMIGAPRGFEQVIRVSLLAIGMTLTALFTRVHKVFA